MKVITEERFIKLLQSGNIKVINSCEVFEEIDTLTPKETDLILAAEKYADLYSDDDRQDIKIDVINAFMRGAEWGKRNK